MESVVLALEQYVMDAGVFAPIVYIAAMIVAIVVSPIPSSPLAIFAGTVFGLWRGMLWTMISATLGAVIAFYIARLFGRPLVLKFVSEKSLKEVENKFPEKHMGWGIFFLRLLPLPFFDAVSYAAGLTHISLRVFLISTVLGLAPLVFIFSYFGDVFFEDLIFVSVLIIAVSLLLSFFVKIVYEKFKKA